MYKPNALILCIIIVLIALNHTAAFCAVVTIRERPDGVGATRFNSRAFGFHFLFECNCFSGHRLCWGALLARELLAPIKVFCPPECLLPSSGRWMCFHSPIIHIRATNQFERSLLVKRFRTVAPKRFSQVATEWLQKLFHVGPSQTWMDVREVPTKCQLKPCDKLSVQRMATRVWY